MTTTPGYTVDALLQAIDKLRSSGRTGAVASANFIMYYARTAELTQVTAQSVEHASPAKDGGYTGWLLEQEIKGVILYYRKTAFTDKPTRNAQEANLYHTEGFAQQVADRIGCGWLVREHEFVPPQPIASQMRPQSAVQGWVLSEDDIATLRHARIFLTSREKMHPVGVEQWDEMVVRLTAPQPPQGEG